MKKILIVDDEMFTLRLMEMKLIQKNCEVDTCNTGTEALEKINSKKYDAIILDVNLAGLSGMEILKRKRKAVNSINHKTPTIMVSASVDYEVVSEAMENNAFDFIIKSFHLEKLTDIVDSIEMYHQAKESKAI